MRRSSTPDSRIRRRTSSFRSRTQSKCGWFSSRGPKKRSGYPGAVGSPGQDVREIRTGQTIDDVFQRVGRILRTPVHQHYGQGAGIEGVPSTMKRTPRCRFSVTSPIPDHVVEAGQEYWSELEVGKQELAPVSEHRRNLEVLPELFEGFADGEPG